MEYRHKGSPTPKKFKVCASAGKVMLTLFFDVNGVVHTEFLPKGTTVNSERYIETIMKLKARLRRVRPDNRAILLLHDNAISHTSKLTTE